MPEPRLITLKIDDESVTVPAGTLVIEVARRRSIEVPSFCYYPGLSLQAACRMCLVEVEKAPKLQTACTLTVAEGMIVRTNTEQVHAARKSMLEFLLTNHPLDCPVCDKGGECELQDMVFRYGADESRFIEEKLHSPEEKWSEVVYYDAPRCILCFRCVRVCDEGMDVKALGVGMRGADSVIIPNREDHLDCEECGMCIDICPVGALTSGTYRYKTRPWEMKYVSTICAHCSNGCKTTLSVRNNEILRVDNRDMSGINGEFLCAKGRFGFDFVAHPERVKQPQIRRNGKFEDASWEHALGEVAARLNEIHKKNGPDAIGFIGSNRTSNEENYLLCRLARATFGTNNVDHHRTADYAGLIAALGASAAESLATMHQLYEAPAVLLIGNDPTRRNPLTAWQVRSGIRHHGTRLYVVNSQDISLSRKAKQVVRVAPGAEPQAMQWLANGNASLDAATAGSLAALKAALENESDVVIVFGSEVSGAAIRDLVSFGSRLKSRTRYIALGDYANSRGAADMGVLPDHLPGYAAIGDDMARDAFGKLWGAALPNNPGLTARQMLDDAVAGKLKALYVVGANPLRTFGVNEEQLRGFEFLVVHEMFMTETAARADVVLPAASAYEKDGTVTATSGEVQSLRRGPDIMGPRTDFDLLRLLSHQLAKLGLGRGFSHRTPEAAFEEIRAYVPGYDVSFANLVAGNAEFSAPHAAPNGRGAIDVPLGAILPARDTLFSSGSLTGRLTVLQSLPEARAK
jgi:NADH-quinone oxidoreductase subunit G